MIYYFLTTNFKIIPTSTLEKSLLYYSEGLWMHPLLNLLDIPLIIMNNDVFKHSLKVLILNFQV